MTTTFAPSSAHLLALDAVVRRAERVESELRRLEADRLQVFADAFDVAAAESSGARGHSSIPRGARAELAYRSVHAELAAAFHLGEATVERRMAHAYALTHHYPDVLQALREGLIDEQHTRVIVDAGSIIGDDDSFETSMRRYAYESAVLPLACEESPNRLRAIARQLAEQHAENSLDERHEDARVRRRVFLVDREDGMSDLIAHLPAIEAHAAYDRLSRAAREAQLSEASPVRTDPSDLSACEPPRSLDEIRADLCSRLLLDAQLPARELGQSETVDSLKAIRAHVQLIVSDQAIFAAIMAEPAELDPTEVRPTPADLAGLGPVDTRSARRLAAQAGHWELIRQDPQSGVVLSVERYRPSESMRRLLRARDLHCRFPGCGARLARCDIDHTIDAAKGGPASTNNLAHLCRRHHTLKHHGGWRVSQQPNGVLEWRAPTGRVHRERPPSRVRFTAVPSSIRPRELPEESEEPKF